MTEFHAAIAAKRHIKWRRRRRTSPADTVSQPIGKPFNGQAKGLLWLTWRSYAGPPQYYIPPEGGALNPPVRRSRSQAEPWQPRAHRPGGCLNPHARKGVSTFGNTATRRSCGTKAKKAPRLLRGLFSLVSGFDIHSIRTTCIVLSGSLGKGWEILRQQGALAVYGAASGEEIEKAMKEPAAYLKKAAETFFRTWKEREE